MVEGGRSKQAEVAAVVGLLAQLGVDALEGVELLAQQRQRVDIVFYYLRCVRFPVDSHDFAAFALC